MWFSVSKVEITGSILSLRGEYVAVDVMGRRGEGREEGGEMGEEVPVNGVDSSITSDDPGVVDIRKKAKKKRSKFDSTTGLEQEKRSKDHSRKRKKSSTDTTSESESGAKRTKTVKEKTGEGEAKRSKAVEEKAGVLSEQSGCSVETRDSVGKEISDKKTRRKHKHKH